MIISLARRASAGTIELRNKLDRSAWQCNGDAEVDNLDQQEEMMRGREVRTVRMKVILGMPMMMSQPQVERYRPKDLHPSNFRLDSGTTPDPNRREEV